MRFTYHCLVVAMVAISSVARADDVHLYAAGSLRAALTDVGAARSWPQDNSPSSSYHLADKIF